jgi:molecular chaperone GrpE
VDEETKVAEEIPDQPEDASEEVKGGADEGDGEASVDEDVEPDPHEQCFAIIDKLREDLAQRDKRLREYIDAHQRAVAEMDAARKRMERDREGELDRHRGEIALTMLEVIDDLDRTLTSASTCGDTESLIQGVSMVRERMVGKMGELGVEQVQTMGTTFDPNLHEAVALVPVTEAEQDQQILAVEQTGYKFKGKTLRAARVVVGAHSDS